MAVSSPHCSVFKLTRQMKNHGRKGAESWPAEDKYGGVSCHCPSEFAGSKCQLCASDAACGAHAQCASIFDARQTAAPLQHLSCNCTSELCQTLQFGPDDGRVDVEMVIGPTPTTHRANIDIVTTVKYPPHQNRWGSPYLIKAHLSSCTQKPDAPCKNLCGAQPCPDTVVWTSKDTCRVFECLNKAEDGPVASECPPAGEPYVGDCAPIKAVMVAPYSFICVVGSSDKNALRCGFATDIITHGQISLECVSGTCLPETPPTPAPVGQPPAPSWCVDNRDVCWDFLYVLICLAPVALLLSFAAFLAWQSREARRIHALISEGAAAVAMSSPGGRSRAAVVDDDESQSGSLLLSAGVAQLVERSRPSFLALKDVSLSVYVGSGRARVLKPVIVGVTGFTRPSEITAVLGPSGAGKSSLIDIISGRKNVGVIGGSVEINGRPCTPEARKWRVGCVSLDDVLPATSTVRELLQFHAALRGPERTAVELSVAVQRVMDALGLTRVAASYVGNVHTRGLSGGEKRRLSIGIELVADACEILALDEPTSGLDSTSSRAVIDALRVVAASGRAVLLSVHQPSGALFACFDRVILLSSSGELLYFGANGAALTGFFEPRGVLNGQSSVPELLLDAAHCSADEARVLREAFELHRAGDAAELEQLVAAHASDSPPSEHKARGWLDQFTHLSTRSLKNAVRHPSLVATNIVANLAVALACSVLYHGVTNDLQGALNRGGLFFFLTAFTMLSCLADVGVWADERATFMRERAAGAYAPMPFLLAKLMAEVVPLRLLPITWSAMLMTLAVGLNPDPRSVLTLAGLLTLLSLTTTLMFLVVGMLFVSSGTTNFICALLVLYNLLMSGFLLQFDGTASGGVTLSWLRQLAPLRFCFEALMVNELHGLAFDVVVKAPDGSEITRATVSGDTIMAQIGFRFENFDGDVGAAILYLCAFFIAAALLLWIIVVEQR